MPELPEVETIRKTLIPIVKNHKIVKIDILRNSTILTNLDEFKEKLTNETFLDVSRIGKYLFFHLTNNLVLISHLRMEGKYFEIDESLPNSPYSRVVFHLDNNKKLCYDDSRCFGIMKLSDENSYLKEEEIAKLGPEPFKIDDEYIKKLIIKLKNCNKPIKSTILDQTLIAGIGNIYADEVLFASKIHPLTKSKNIDFSSWRTIIANAKEILTAAINYGGSTIKSYHPGQGVDGKFQTYLQVYGQKNHVCPRCGHKFHFIKVGGRGTTYCPFCQKNDHVVIAIFGKIASGKSTVLEQFSQNGYETFSCDEIVNSIYQKPEVIEYLNKTFGYNFKDKIDKKIIREDLIKNPSHKKMLENYIHPQVISYLEKEIKKYPRVAVEVPLLFEAHLENYFEFLLAVDTNKDIQYDRLLKRNPNKAKDLYYLNNKNSKFDLNKTKADFVIDNSGSYEDLQKQVLDIVNILK